MLTKLALGALALTVSAIGWICLYFAPVAFDHPESRTQLLGLILLFAGAAYQLLAMALGLKSMGRFEGLEGKNLYLAFTIAGFVAPLPIAIEFRLGDDPFHVAAICLLLTTPPVLLYASRVRADQVNGKEEDHH